jgi:hypothetical protein
MPYWIFKLSKQELYPDVPGSQYVYDNTHSLRVRAGDIFLYLDKRKNYSFTATGCISNITTRAPTAAESSRAPHVRTVFSAHLSDLVHFIAPLSISPLTPEGRANRAKLGLTDVNLMGWSQSIPKLSEQMYEAIMQLAQTKRLLPAVLANSDFSIPDTWGKVRIRKAIGAFTNEVLNRHQSRCVVCGTTIQEVLDAAHLSPYAADVANRANPRNGVCLCTYCHRALDQRLIALTPDGVLLISPSIHDPIAAAHFTAVGATTRRAWLSGVEPKFLELTVTWFNEAAQGNTKRKSKAKQLTGPHESALPHGSPPPPAQSQPPAPPVPPV